VQPVILVHKDLSVIPDHKAILEILDQQEQLVTQDYKVHKVILVLQDLRDLHHTIM
jgi:hypothetical protein